MPTLPNDVLAIIISPDNFWSQGEWGDLFRICLVSKEFLQLGRAALWWRRYVRCYDKKSRREDAPPIALGDHIRHLTFLFDDDELPNLHKEAIEQVITAYITSWLAASPKLHAVTVKLEEVILEVYSDPVYIVLAAAAVETYASRIKELTINSGDDAARYGESLRGPGAAEEWMMQLQEMPNLRYLNIGFSAACEGLAPSCELPLNTLSLQVTNYPFLSDQKRSAMDWVKFGSTDFATMIMMESAATLHRLEISDAWEPALAAIIDDAGRSFQSLTSLLISNLFDVFTSDGFHDQLLRVLPFLPALAYLGIDVYSGHMDVSDIAEPNFFNALPLGLQKLEIGFSVGVSYRDDAELKSAAQARLSSLMSFIEGGRCSALRELVLDQPDGEVKEKIKAACEEKGILLTRRRYSWQ